MKNADYRLELKRRNHLRKSIEECRPGGSLELIVEVDGRKKDRAVSVIEGFGKIRHVYDFIDYVSFECDFRDAYGIANVSTRGYSELSRALRRVEASSVFHAPKTVEGCRVELWNLSCIGAYEARGYASGAGIKIAVIDTGVDYSHPELSGRFGRVKGYDFIRSNDEPVDMNGHGTHVAGICAGTDYGVAPGSTLYSLRFLDELGSGSESDAIASVEWCLENGVHIANMSFGSSLASSAFEQACYVAAENGLVLVAAAGNDGGEYASYPAAFGESVIAVAAVDRYKRHAEFSNMFITNDVSAPGVGIESSYLGGSYAVLDGTSMAAPHVSGSVALAIEVLASGSVNDLLERTCEEIGYDREVFGAGLVRADRMVAEAVKPGFYGLVDMIKSIAW
ncbi:S8 family peptidase [Candidatus Woesearchaeota archaeon]|nr:S8 family peptidase [Candidatus Woesearchaeota archaeon]